MAPLAEPAALEVTGLACGYPGRNVLADVSFSLPVGSITVLLGPNGSGKSTLLKTLSGVLKPTGGGIRLFGQAIATMKVGEIARQVGFVPQEEKPQFAFTVEEVVGMGRLPFADSLMDSDSDRVIAQEAVIRAGCGDLMGRSVLELSGGELQRVLVARALAQSPKILLLDEPTSHLDARHALELADTLKVLATEGVTVVAAIHDLNLAGLFGEHGLLFGGGRLVRSGPLLDVLNGPELDATFEVTFRRVESEGRLLLSPTASTHGTPN